jgi:hypothetical protein
MNGKYEMWPLFHLGAIWRNFIFSDHLFSLWFRVFPLFSRPGGKINANPEEKNTRIFCFWPLGGKKTGCTFGHFFAIFRLLARFHDRLMENSCFPFGAMSNMCASGNIVGFSPCFLGTRSRAPSPRAQKTGKIKPPISP